MKTSDLLKQLIDKRFNVMVAGEKERTCDFLGMMCLLERRSDFFQYTPLEQKQALKSGIEEKEVYIDAKVTLTF